MAVFSRYVYMDTELKYDYFSDPFVYYTAAKWPASSRNHPVIVSVCVSVGYFVFVAYCFRFSLSGCGLPGLGLLVQGLTGHDLLFRVWTIRLWLECAWTFWLGMAMKGVAMKGVAPVMGVMIL